MPAYRFLPVSTPPGSTVIEVALDVLRATAFWAAILLVIAYPIALALPGWVAIEHVGLLVATHVAALLVGHGHATR